MALDLQMESQSKQTQEESSRSLGPAAVDFTTPSSWSVVKLPRYFLLKGDNGKYLKSVRNRVDRVTDTFIADHKMDATVFEAVPLPWSEGSVAIRSLNHGLFFIAGGVDGYDGSLVVGLVPSLSGVERHWRAQFWAVKLGRGSDSRLIGLRLFNGSQILEQMFCYNDGLRNNSSLSCVSGEASNPSRGMGFELEEAVSQRSMYGITYHMDRVRISDHEPLTSVTKDVLNRSNTPQKGVLSFSHTERESQSWGSTDSWKITTSVTMSVRIPFVGGPEISTDAYYSGAYEWGEEKATSKEIGTELEVQVPPMSMVQATMIVQKGKLEVPFSYGQRDTTYNGLNSFNNFEDGLFTSVNTYVTYETTKRSLA